VWVRKRTEREKCGLAGALTYGLLHHEGATWDLCVKTGHKNDGRQIAHLDTHVSWSVFADATMRVSGDIDTWDE